MQGTGFAIAEKLCLDGEPGRPCRSAAPHNGFSEFGGDGAVKPGADDAVHPLPIRRGGGWSVFVDVVLEGETADGEQELLVPPRVGAGGSVEDDGYEAADVLYAGDLGVEVQNSGSLMKEHGGADVVGGRAIGVGVGVGVAFLVGGGASVLAHEGGLALRLARRARVCETLRLGGGRKTLLLGGRGFSVVCGGKGARPWRNQGGARLGQRKENHGGNPDS